MCLVCHARVFPIVENLAGKLRAFATCFVAFLVDRAVVHGAHLQAKVFNVKWFALNSIAASAIVEIIAAFTVYSAW